jgi:tRNA A-37 threonylcarbamoyl transferase component Bud32
VMALAAHTLEHELRTPTMGDPSALLNVRLLRGVAHGMAAVHAQQITHRDLKPANVLLSPDGVPWITDFGLSTCAHC